MGVYARGWGVASNKNKKMRTLMWHACVIYNISDRNNKISKQTRMHTQHTHTHRHTHTHTHTQQNNKTYSNISVQKAKGERGGLHSTQGRKGAFSTSPLTYIVLHTGLQRTCACVKRPGDGAEDEGDDTEEEWDVHVLLLLVLWGELRREVGGVCSRTGWTFSLFSRLVRNVEDAGV